jgi:hypothetical protein
MKKILLAFLLLFSTTAFASSAQDALCAEMTVRLTLFTVSAGGDWKENNYKSYWYKKIITNSDEKSKKILMTLVDIAWASKDQDINDVAMRFYKACAEGVST